MAGNDLPLKLQITRLYNSMREWILADVQQMLGNNIVGGKIVGSQISGTIPSTSIPNTAVTAGSYGDSTHVGSFTVGADGRLTAASNVAITSLEVKEADGSPDVTGVTQIIVSNGTLTNNGGGSVSLSTGGGGGSVAPVISAAALTYAYSSFR